MQSRADAGGGAGPAVSADPMRLTEEGPATEVIRQTLSTWEVGHSGQQPRRSVSQSPGDRPKRFDLTFRTDVFSSFL